GGTLGGATSEPAVNGVATFNTLSIDKTGTGYTLTASDATLPPASNSVTSNAFNVTPAAADHLVLATQPNQTPARQAVRPVTVRVVDAFGNLETANTSSVSVSIATNGGSPAGTLSGTLTVNAVGGVATFNNLAIDKTGAGYTLAFIDSTLPPAGDSVTT